MGETHIGNWPLLMLAIEHILKHPEAYEQSEYRSECGSHRCVAGWIAFFGGWRDVVTGSNGWGSFQGVRLEGGPTEPLSIEQAALFALELNRNFYGEVPACSARDYPDVALDENLREFTFDLFGGNLELFAVLSKVDEMAIVDGVTVTPVIEAAMTALSVGGR